MFISSARQNILKYYLARVVETFPDKEVDEGPGCDEADEQVPLHCPDFLDSRADVQNLVARIIK